jgi:hypothetical protein
MDHNLAEVLDLVKLYDFRVARGQAKVDKNAVAISAKDPMLLGDWASMLTRYNAAKRTIPVAPDSFLANTPGEKVDPTGVNASEAWDAIALAMQQVPMTRSTGDLNDLLSRLSLAGFAPNMQGEPKPAPRDSWTDQFYKDTEWVPTPDELAKGAAKIISTVQLVALVWIAHETGLLRAIGRAVDKIGSGGAKKKDE